MKQTSLRFLLICACLTQLAACGQKGPLYMPGKPATLPTPAPAKSSTGAPEAPATSSAASASTAASATK